MIGWEDISMDRLAEILAAERGGRCVVLPCRLGDTIYKLPTVNLKPTGEISERKITGVYISYSTIAPDNCVGYADESNFGKTVFLTRESAEKALGGNT
jgi:hypothetical protein